MSIGAYSTGQAVFIRTDTLNFEERSISFSSLEELVELCTKPRPNLTLEKVIVYRLFDGESTAVTLSFIAATKGQKIPPQQTSQESTDKLLDAAAESKSESKPKSGGSGFSMYDLYD